MTLARFGVFGAIFDEGGRILCVRRAYPPQNWTLPGGGVETAESPIEALVREVREETGFEVVPDSLIGVYAAPSQDGLVLFFECAITGRLERPPDEEIAEHGFFEEKGLPSPLSERAALRIKHAFSKERGLVHVWK